MLFKWGSRGGRTPFVTFKSEEGAGGPQSGDFQCYTADPDQNVGRNVILLIMTKT